VVSGDDVLPVLRGCFSKDVEADLQNLDTGASIAEVQDRLVTANAYLGAAPIIAALEQGADIVITGRTADPSLTVAPCAHHFGWAADDWDRWAAATVAGHLIECGTQVTGGISTDWLSLPEGDPGFPVIEMSADGSFIVTKPTGTGGIVNRFTVAEQLVYEIGDPDCYLSPDLTVSFQNLRLEELGHDRVRVTGAAGRPPTPTYKVSATYRDGYRAVGQLTIFGQSAVRKAERCAAALRDRVEATGKAFRRFHFECLGANACSGHSMDADTQNRLQEVVLRVGIEVDDRDVADFFSRQFIPLVTAGPQGTTGYAEGRPHVHPVYRYWPCLVARSRVHPEVQMIETTASPRSAPERVPAVEKTSVPISVSSRAAPALEREPPKVTRSACLGDIACARSGDKGINANVGVIARRGEDYDALRRFLTAERVRAWFAPLEVVRVERFELPRLSAMNFVLYSVLANSLRSDAQGKTLGQVLLTMPLDQFET
jgi:hypothetical protein